jgi:hypothetical protein
MPARFLLDLAQGAAADACLDMFQDNGVPRDSRICAALIANVFGGTGFSS